MIKYKEPEKVPEDEARQMVEILEDNGPMKPWTLVSRVETDMPTKDTRMKVLKPLTLKGVLTPTADGDMRIMDKDKLEKVLS